MEQQAGCHNWEQLLKLGLWDRAWGAGCLHFYFKTFLNFILTGLEAKVRAVGSLKPWTANVEVLSF